MPGLKFCNHQEECPLVMGAVEAKVKLQTELAVQRKEWEAKRAIMNSLYLAAVKNIGSDRAEEMLAELARVDTASKFGGISGYTAIELYIMQNM